MSAGTTTYQARELRCLDVSAGAQVRGQLHADCRAQLIIGDPDPDQEGKRPVLILFAFGDESLKALDFVGEPDAAKAACASLESLLSAVRFSQWHTDAKAAAPGTVLTVREVTARDVNGRIAKVIERPAIAGIDF